MNEQDKLQEISRLSANIDQIISIRIAEQQAIEFNRIVKDADNLVAHIRSMTGDYAIMPESQREDFLALADGRTQKTLLRWRLEGVIAVQKEYGRVWELRADGNVNMIDSGVIIYTTEPFEKPTDSWSEREAFEPKITPYGIRSLRVRGLV